MSLELKGLRVGRLKVLYKSKKDKNGNNYWMCKCDCGNLTEVRATYLNLKKVKSCGCLNRGEKPYLELDLTGFKLNSLTAIEKSHKDKNGSVVWKCLCDCGKYCYVRGSNLKSGETKSCGCLHAEQMKRYGVSRRKAYGEASRNSLIRGYKNGAEKRNLNFSLSIEECEDLFKGNCHYCDKEPSQVIKVESCFGEYIYNGIDRVINEKHYSTNNTVSCCRQCNERKGALACDEFLNHVDRIYNNLSKIKQIVYPLLSIDKIIIDKTCDFEKVNFIKTHPRMKAPGVSNRNSLLNQYKYSAKDRNLSFNLTKEEATFLFKSNCYYCQRPPHQVQNNKGSNGAFTYTGIDRVKNDTGYKKDNVVPCCKRCNSWKKALAYDQFRAWVVRVYENTHVKEKGSFSH